MIIRFDHLISGDNKLSKKQPLMLRSIYVHNVLWRMLSGSLSISRSRSIQLVDHCAKQDPYSEVNVRVGLLLAVTSLPNTSGV